MAVKIGDVEVTVENLSQEDLQKLIKMIPYLQQQTGKMTQLEIILEAIKYIEVLQSKLQN